MNEIDLTEPPEDRVLLIELGRALRAGDPVPDQWRWAAEQSFTWRSVDTELAELVFDSLASAGSAAGAALVRGAATRERMLAFEGPTLRVELEVSPTTAGAFLVVGQLVPETAGTVELRQGAAQPMVVKADDQGCFQADGVSAGPLSLRCTVAGTGPVDTAWLVV
ncbi:MAG: hypothetical protein ACRD1K_08545 [Acidimicrobiales bacterium]